MEAQLEKRELMEAKSATKDLMRRSAGGGAASPSAAASGGGGGSGGGMSAAAMAVASFMSASKRSTLTGKGGGGSGAAAAAAGEGDGERKDAVKVNTFKRVFVDPPEKVPASLLFDFERNPSAGGTPYHLDGNKDYYDDDALEVRRNLRKHPKIIAQIDRFWSSYAKDPHPHHPTHSVIGMAEYVKVYMLMVKALYREFHMEETLLFEKRFGLSSIGGRISSGNQFSIARRLQCGQKGR